jgi:DNA replication and repair protein RecF
MYFTSLRVRDFRNYARAELTFEKKKIVFLGANGQGKTNLLEALYLLSNGKSFRTSRLSRMLRWDSAAAHLVGTVRDEATRREVAVGFSTEERHFLHEGEEVRGGRDFVGIVDTFLLVPQDIDFIDGSPRRRRDVFDRGIFQIDPDYLDAYQQYNRALRQRNSLLKTGGANSDSHLHAWEGAMAAPGAVLMARRADYAREINQRMGLIQDELGGVDQAYAVKYRPSCREDARDVEGFHRLLLEQRAADLEAGYTRTGPHRDDVSLRIKDMPARDHASLGQKRTFVLVFLFAALDHYVERRRRLPVLLIDDLELDAARCATVLQYIERTYPEMQVFFTSTSPEKFRFPEPAGQYFQVNAGNVAPLSPEGEQG